MHDYLLIKATSLAAEAKLIRAREQKRLKAARNARAKNKPIASVTKHMAVYKGLNDHRRVNVRNEARWTNLARGFLRGKTYLQIENISYQQPDWERVELLIMTYGEGNKEDLAARFMIWEQEALRGVNANYNPFTYPGSTRKHISPWVLRNHGQSFAQWLAWRRTQFPLKPRKQWLEEPAIVA